MRYGGEGEEGGVGLCVKGVLSATTKRGPGGVTTGI